MSELSKSELISYIREVFRLEHKKQTIIDSSNNIRKEINKLKDTPYASKPFKEEYPTPEFPHSTGTNVIIKLIVAGVVAYTVLQVAFVVVSFLFALIFGKNEVLVILGGGIGALVLAILSAVLVFKIWSKSEQKNKVADYQRQIVQYNKNKQLAEEEYNANLIGWEKNCAMIDEENLQKKTEREYRQSVITQLENVVQEIDKSLNKLYSYDILHRNYRNYKAVGYILLYFETGRVDTLKEAINKYEDELFKGMVVEALDEIAFNQELTYDAIRENNMLIQGATNNIGTIISQNEKISDYQQLAAANSKDILDSVQNIDFRQTIEMLDRYASN